MSYKAGILVFPGTNCEHDLKIVLEKYYNCKVEFLWHTNSFKTTHDIYFIPGGFSYGDYIRSGILAASSISIHSLKQAVSKNKKVLGICNGFQILTESKLLPGVLLKNHTHLHICQWVKIRMSNFFVSHLPINSTKQEIFLPISHSEGNYYCTQEDYKKITDENNIILQYTDNINGSYQKIAGIKNKNNNIWGMMPHPERAFSFAKDIPNIRYQYGKSIMDKIFSFL